MAAAVSPSQVNPSLNQAASEENDCVICLESLERTSDEAGHEKGDPVTLVCSHVFHKICLAEQQRSGSPNCALCRAPIRVGAPEVPSLNRAASHFFARLNFFNRLFTQGPNCRSWNISPAALRILKTLGHVLTVIASAIAGGLTLAVILPMIASPYACVAVALGVIALFSIPGVCATIYLSR